MANGSQNGAERRSQGLWKTPFSIRLLENNNERGADAPRHDHDRLLSLLPASYRIDIDSWLWIAGLPMPPRALHYQLLLNLGIFITERMDMHLVWTSGRLQRRALGFLFSYAALISHESDFHIAKEKHLLPAEVEWLAWRRFVEQLDTHNIYPRIDLRFHHGELVGLAIEPLASNNAFQSASYGFPILFYFGTTYCRLAHYT
ncbi:hypothetical protein V8C42DRAFT_350000 [Trichoderma barbatum]